MATDHSTTRDTLVNFGVWLLKGLCALPLHTGARFGAWLGATTFFFSKRRRGVCRRNIELCFPELNVKQREELAYDVFLNNGIGLIETGWAWWADPAKFWPKLEVEGQEHLDAALAHGKGVLLIGGHYSALDLGGLLFAKIAPRFAATYRPHNFQRLEDELLIGRGRFMDLIDRNDVRGIFKALAANQIVWFAPDQDLGADRSVFAPFFGIPTATNAGLRKMAKRGAQPLAISFHRLDHDHYRVCLRPWGADATAQTDVEFATRMNEILEQEIRREPAQYMWVHRRFKTRPEGEGEVY